MTQGLHPLRAAILEPFLNPESRTYWVGLVVFLGVLLLFWLKSPKEERTFRVWRTLSHPSSQLDLQLLVGRQLTRPIIALPAWATGWLFATHSVRWMDHQFGAPAALNWAPEGVAILYGVCLFVTLDLSRFLLHWMSHKVPALWALHKVHHSAEVLTPLTFHRIHPLESLLFDLRGALVTGGIASLFYYFFRDQLGLHTVLGLPALGFVFNLALGNLRHSHIWIRFPRRVERIFLSPAQHQMHHSADPHHFDTNMGTWLAIWDRIFGTWQPATTPPAAFGLSPAERNHQHNLLSAWFSPLRGSFRWLGLLALFGLGVAHAEEATEEATEEPVEDKEESESPDPNEDSARYGEQLFIYQDGRTPRVAGSAHHVDETALKRFEYTNIEQILAQVPGMNTRNEDGFGLRPNIGIRGANSDRSAKITLMEDGILLAPAPYAAPAAYYFPMSNRLVGVEVFKGPAATRHGPFTVGGAVNLLTRSIPEKRTAQVDLSAGLYGTRKLHMWSGAQTDNAGMLFEAFHLASDGFKQLDSGGPTGFERSEFMLKSEWLATADQRLELKLGYATESSNETYLGLSASDAELTPYRRYAASDLGQMEWQRTQAELEWTGRIGPAIRFRSVAYHHYLDRSWNKFNGFSGGLDVHNLLQSEPGGQGAVFLAILRGEEDSFGSDQRLQIGNNHRVFHSFGLQNTAEWAVEGEGFLSRMEFGLRLHGDHVRRDHTESPYAMRDGTLEPEGLSTTTLSSVSTAQALAVHVHEDLSLGRFHFFPGVRVEVVRTWQQDEGLTEAAPQIRATPLPGAGTLVEITPDLDGFAGIHRGFSPVAPGQAAEVLPEQSWNTEAGFRVDKGIGHLEWVGFYNDYSNITGQCTFSAGCNGDNLDQQYNGGAATIAGLETVAGLRWGLGEHFNLPAQLSYSWTQSRFTTDFTSGFSQYGRVEAGDFLPYVAAHQAHLQVGIQHSRGALHAGLSYRGAMRDTAGSLDNADIPPLLLLDASAHAQLSREWSLKATGTNLTGQTAITSWRPFGARPTAPLQIMLSLQWAPAGG
jgi:Fe(3+) dicitrate transport protein